MIRFYFVFLFIKSFKQKQWEKNELNSLKYGGSIKNQS